MSLLRRVSCQLRDFSGYSADATYLWPRWLVLRAVGLVYLLVFAGIIAEGKGLVGPAGIVPMSEYAGVVQRVFPNVAERILRAPSLFLLGTGWSFVSAVAWGGLLAAIGVVLNLWPRVTLAACWIAHLSFVALWQIFSPTIIDQLMIETAFLSMFFAPPGLRPGLGAAWPVRPLVLLVLRWLLLRLMFGSGVIKLLAGDPHWRDFTAMEVMYETSPSPTVLAYHDFHLPRAYHALEIAITFTAELVAPLAAVFLGRRGRWFAFAVWTLFQAGIQATGNFGWLNTAAIGLGLLLLDDQMLAASAAKLRWPRAAARFSTAPPGPAAGRKRAGNWLAAALCLHIVVTGCLFLASALNRPAPLVPDPRTRPVEYFLRDFRIANAYVPFAAFPLAKFEVEFVASNDRGKTWRVYPFRYKPQEQDRMSPFLAPRFGRFDASLQLALVQNSTLIPRVAHALLENQPDVIALFARNPFPDQPPNVVRMMVFRYTYTDPATRRRTGHYWHKEFAGDFRGALYRDATGRIVSEDDPGK